MVRLLITGAGGCSRPSRRRAQTSVTSRRAGRAELDVTIQVACDSVGAIAHTPSQLRRLTERRRRRGAPRRVDRINARGGQRRRPAAEVTARVVQVSTDYVFDGPSASRGSSPTPPPQSSTRRQADGDEQTARPRAAHDRGTSWLFRAGRPELVERCCARAERDEIAVGDR